jgi:hypothetical protein
MYPVGLKRRLAALLCIFSLVSCTSWNRVVPSDDSAVEAEIRKNLAADGVTGMTITLEKNVAYIEGPMDPNDTERIRADALKVRGVREVVIVASTAGKQMTNYASETWGPPLPWPLMQPSDVAEIPLVVRNDSKPRTLGDLADVITRAMSECDYAGFRFYSVPAGFGIVTPLEEVRDDGSRLPASERMNIEAPPHSEFNLLWYLRALIGGRVGYYRLLAIIVTPRDLIFDNAEATSDDAKKLAMGSRAVLPQTAQTQQVIHGTRIFAVIYEFSRRDIEKSAHLMRPSHVPASRYLQADNLWPTLLRNLNDSPKR